MKNEKHIKTEFDKERDKEILLIKKYVKEIFGVSVSKGVCIHIWCKYSEESCAGWITVDKAGVARAFTRYGPYQEIDDLLAQINGMDSKFRVLFLNRLDGMYCLRCGEHIGNYCKRCDKFIFDK